MSSLPQPVQYGLVVAIVVIFVGWVTGMGGGLISNILFGALMGLFAAICFTVATRIGSRGK